MNVRVKDTFLEWERMCTTWNNLKDDKENQMYIDIVI